MFVAALLVTALLNFSLDVPFEDKVARVVYEVIQRSGPYGALQSNPKSEGSLGGAYVPCDRNRFVPLLASTAVDVV